MIPPVFKILMGCVHVSRAYFFGPPFRVGSNPIYYLFINDRAFHINGGLFSLVVQAPSHGTTVRAQMHQDASKLGPDTHCSCPGVSAITAQ